MYSGLKFLGSRVKVDVLIAPKDDSLRKKGVYIKFNQI